MNQGPEQHVIDINVLPYEVSHEILKHLDFKELATLSSLNGSWYKLVQERCQALIALYFPYLLAQRENDIKANAFHVFKEEYRRYKRCFPNIDISFILEALSGSLEKIAHIKETHKIILCALFVSNAHILPNELLEENKQEIIEEAFLLAAGNGQLQVINDLLARKDIAYYKGYALHEAVARDQLEVVKLLLTLPEIPRRIKSWQLYYAAKAGHVEIVKYLLTLPDISAKFKVWSLKMAAKRSLEIVKLLSALPEMTPQDKGQALRKAVERRQLEIVEHLATLPQTPLLYKVMALYDATQHRFFEIAKILLRVIMRAPKDSCLTYLNRALTGIQTILNLPFLRRHKTALGRLMLATTMCLGLTVKFPLIRAGWSVFLGYSAGAMLVSMLLSTLYQRYMERTFVNYNTPEKIQTITDTTEMQALKAGVEAKSRWGYAKSFTVYATYCRMSAFNAGKKCALNDAHPSLAEIAKLRVS